MTTKVIIQNDSTSETDIIIEEKVIEDSRPYNPPSRVRPGEQLTVYVHTDIKIDITEPK